MNAGGLRGTLKRVAESVLVTSGIGALARHRHRGRTLILAYHNILPAGAPGGSDQSLHLALADFERHLDLLERESAVVPLELARRPAGRISERPRVALTFDDAYQGAVTAGIKVLARRGLPATIFVTPGFLGGRSFWWDVLTPGGGEIRDHALRELGGDDAAIRRWAPAAGQRLVEPGGAARSATEAELLSALAHHPGLTLGAHTWSHPNLTRQPAERLIEELTRPRRWLQERFGERYLDLLSYPYGLTSPAVEQAAAAAGYRGGFLIAGGWLPDDPEGVPFRLPRLNVPAALSTPGLSLRLSGLFHQ